MLQLKDKNGKKYSFYSLNGAKLIPVMTDKGALYLEEDANCIKKEADNDKK